MDLRKAALTASLLAALAAVPAAPAVAASDSGQSLYTQNCAMCHGADGKGGVPGAPDFTKAGGVLAQSDDVLTGRVLNGYSSPGAAMSMPPFKGQLSADQVHEILEYMHKTFGVPAKKGGGS